ncbi:MAG: serine hydroxymethyltransferase [Christensenellaceae bacterium]|jgi:glycine hydroxymethyltransferase|nr:serine hydroxymethyltransferase [Christensenellaceae bacterium]
MTQMEKLIKKEFKRQNSKINLIASENIASRAVMSAMGSCLTNKYAEGYPGARYYGGCEVVDEVENLARDLAKKLFGAEYANVQPHCGSAANMAVYFALLQPGDTILSMSLDAGGHLTHGAKVSFSGKTYNIIHYGLDENGILDYANLEKLAKQHKPKLILSGASAYSRLIDFERIRKICDDAGALMMVDMAHFAGLVAAGLVPSPVPYADVVTSTTHKTLRGPRGGLILAKEKYGKAIDKAIFPGIQGGPLMNIIGAKAVCFAEALTPEYKTYMTKVKENANYLAAALTSRGLKLISGGTDTHLFLVDLRESGRSGREVQDELGALGIVVNKNKLEGDPRSAQETSAIRIGTPFITNFKGVNARALDELADIITAVVSGEIPPKKKILAKIFK